MVFNHWLTRTAVVAATGLLAGCGSHRLARLPVPSPEPGPVPTQAAQSPAGAQRNGAVQALIETSQRHFLDGEQALERGHLDQAKLAFNRALGVLLESPDGARSDVRLREQFDRLVDRISTYEVMALSEGDGFTETPQEPASIDDLLAVSTFETLSASPAVQEAVTTELKTTTHDVPIPLNDRVMAYVELFQGRLHDWVQEGLRRGTRYLPMIQSVFRCRGPAARPGLRAVDRKRVQAERALPREGEGSVAVHARDRARARPQERLVC